MSVKHYYLATIQIAIEATSEKAANEAIQGSLPERITKDGAIFDLRYDPEHPYPTLGGIFNDTDYEEGTAFKSLKLKFREFFQTPYTQYAEHKGRFFELLHVNRKTEPTETQTYRILLGNGLEIDALPEEIFTGLGWEPIPATPYKP